MADLIIRGGTIVDGTGTTPYEGDIAITAGTITEIGKITTSAPEEIDARGKLVTPGSGGFDGGAWTRTFTAAPDNAEHAGYLACTQSPDGTIHLISSRLHYRFNLAWLKQPAP